MGFEQFSKKYKEFSIYGCGQEGRILSSIMKEKNVIVNSYIISDNAELPQDIQNIDYPVYKISEWINKKLMFNIGILIPETSKYCKEMVENLKENKIEDFYVISRNEYIRCIGFLDTRISDSNHGNNIIMQSVEKYTNKIFEKDFVYQFPYWDYYDGYTLRFMETCKYLILGGTNALNSHMEKQKLIGVNSENISKIYNKGVLMGVGWWKYEDEPDDYTKSMLSKFLNKQVLHSVRDGYTKQMLESIGITNVINTGCPTIWGLDSEHCEQIPENKADDVLIMVSGCNVEVKKRIVQIARKNYRKIYFWIQEPIDLYDMKRFCPEAKVINPSLQAIDQFLEEHKNIDYIGSRLHCGIKCLQHKKRSFIIAIDNRAIEMKKSYGLPVIEQSNIDVLETVINQKMKIDIKIPKKNITRWLEQF